MREPVAVFMALQTQWRWVSAGAAGAFRVGLEYLAIPTVAAALDVKVTADLFNDIRVLEREALTVWSARRG